MDVALYQIKSILITYYNLTYLGHVYPVAMWIGVVSDSQTPFQWSAKLRRQQKRPSTENLGRKQVLYIHGAVHK